MEDATSDQIAQTSFSKMFLEAFPRKLNASKMLHYTCTCIWLKYMHKINGEKHNLRKLK